MSCVEDGWVPQSALVDGEVVPILGLMEVLAVSRLLADTDVLGGGGNNAGFVVERDGNGRPIAVRVVKARGSKQLRMTCCLFTRVSQFS